MLRRKIRVKRRPLLSTVRFQSCNLCYKKSNCCPHISSCCRPVVISKHYRTWDKLLETLQRHQAKGNVIRVVTEQVLSNDIIWAMSYSELNVLQVNVDIQQDWESIKWAISMAHKAEKCGVECLLFIYPVLPPFVKTYHVLQLIDAINDCRHCKIMIRFGDFINYGLFIQSGFIILRGNKIPLSLVNRIDGDLWGCTEEFKSQFMEYLKFYADDNKIDVRACEVIR